MITIKHISTYYTDEDMAVIERKAELNTALTRRQSELAEVDAAIANREDIVLNSEDQIQNLIAGIEVLRPQPLSAKRIELQYIIRDIEQAIDFMNGKERQVSHKASIKLTKDIKPAVDIAERELAKALIAAHEAHLTYWQAKRCLLNNGIALCGLFGSNIDEILGVPMDNGTALADLFRAAVAAGHLKSVPVELRR